MFLPKGRLQLLSCVAAAVGWALLNTWMMYSAITNAHRDGILRQQPQFSVDSVIGVMPVWGLSYAIGLIGIAASAYVVRCLLRLRWIGRFPRVGLLMVAAILAYAAVKITPYGCNMVTGCIPIWASTVALFVVYVVSLGVVAFPAIGIVMGASVVVKYFRLTSRRASDEAAAGQPQNRENSGYQAVMANNEREYRISGMRIAAICAVTILFMIFANLIFIFFATASGRMAKEFADYAGGQTWSVGLGFVVGALTIWVSSLMPFSVVTYIYSFIYLASALGAIQSVVMGGAKGMAGIGSVVLSLGMAAVGFCLAVKWIPVATRRNGDSSTTT